MVEIGDFDAISKSQEIPRNKFIGRKRGRNLAFLGFMCLMKPHLRSLTKDALESVRKVLMHSGSKIDRKMADQ